jgi:hypothetical protein
VRIQCVARAVFVRQAHVLEPVRKSCDETTYDDRRRVSPLLGSRNGLNTADDPMAVVAAKIAELVAVEDD